MLHLENKSKNIVNILRIYAQPTHISVTLFKTLPIFFIYIPINVLWALLLWKLGGWWALLNLYLVPACILWNAGSLINTVCHTSWLGYRRYNVPDNSVNNSLLGMILLGFS